MATAIERLETVLNAKDDEIRELREKLDGAQRLLSAAREGWRYADVGPSADAPVPRLELLYIPRPHWDDYQVHYRLVMRHLQGHLVAIPVGCTTIEGGEPNVEPDRLPIYDGSHIAHDSGYLSLPAYRIMPGRLPERINLDQYLIQVELGRAHRLEEAT
jgi:hypothetical protein